MALALFDRVQETTTTTGTGSVTLAGALPGFQSFAVVGNGNTCYYTIVDVSAWEVGIGTYSTSGPTLARTTILSNSNGNTSPITLVAGVKSVFLTYPAEKSVNLDANDNVSPLGTVSSGVWQGSTVGVAYGGTGVTASSGANSVVLRDGNQNIAVNRVNQSNTNTTAAGGTTALTAASSYIHTLVGTGGQTYTLPDATTLTTGVAFVFNNLATGALTLANYAGTTIGTVPSGGAGAVFLTLNSTVGGTWDLHAYLPEGVTFGTNAFNLGTSVISGGTWQGGTIQTGYGGTGLTSYTSGGAVYANSSSTLTSGTLPISAGGTGATTAAGAQSSLNVPSTTGSGASGTWGINITGSAGSLPNAVTFNSGGAGDASGTSFNGAAARTISYNTIGAPSTTGTNASGTWGINVTGSAGSASSATTSTYVTSQDIRTLSPSSTAAARMAFGFTSWANNNSAPYADYLAMRSYTDASGGNDNLLMLNKSTIAMRVYQQAYGSATAYSSYADVLMSNNYNSYAPTLTGGGASGTWGINITGNASGSSTSVSATTATGIQTNYAASINTTTPGLANYGVVFSGVASPDSAQGITWGWSGTNAQAGIYVQSSGSYGTKMYFGTTDSFATGSKTSMSIDHVGVVQIPRNYLQSDSSLRAPIFYDSNDTGFYVDPNSTSRLNGVSVYTGALGFVNAARGSYYGYSSSYGTVIYGATSGSITPCFNVDPIANPSGSFNGNGGEVMFRNGVQFISPNSSNNGYNNYFVLQDGYAAANNSFRAPIFYDSNNTAYYVDPNGTSVLTTAIFYVNGSSEITFTSAGTNASMIKAGSGDELYLGGNNTWQMRFSGANVLMDNGGYLLNGESIRSPIFYDSSNTAYYVDPAPGSNGVSANFQGRIQVGTFNNSQTNSGEAWLGRASDRSSGTFTVQLGGGSSSGRSFEVVDYAWTVVLGSINSDGNSFAYSSYRAPIFYDRDDTGYYLNPNGSSFLYGLVLSGNQYFRPNTWIQCDTSAGIYWPNHYGAHFYPNGSSTYTQLQIDGSKNSYSGMYISHSAVNGMMYDSAGNGGVYREANGRWYFYHNLSNNCMGVGTSSTNAAYGIYVIKGVYSEGNVVAYSDERVKTNWRDYPADFVEQLAKVKHGTYDRTDMELTQDGVSAQSLQKLLPYSAPVDKNDRLAVNYGGAALVSAVELAKYVTALEQRISQLEARL